MVRVLIIKRLTGIYRTYEELKPFCNSAINFWFSGIYRTYEELKHMDKNGVIYEVFWIYRTYEELKPETIEAKMFRATMDLSYL